MIILYRDQQRSGNVFMEKRYRGYPPEVKKVPWMLYRREEQSAGPVLTGKIGRASCRERVFRAV